ARPVVGAPKRAKRENLDTGVRVRSIHVSGRGGGAPRLYLIEHASNVLDQHGEEVASRETGERLTNCIHLEPGVLDVLRGEATIEKAAPKKVGNLTLGTPAKIHVLLDDHEVERRGPPPELDDVV